MTTHKTKHIHVVAATISVALEYSPDDLEQVTALNSQIREAARKLPGYRGIEIKLGKVPAPPAAAEAPMVPRSQG